MASIAMDLKMPSLEEKEREREFSLPEKVGFVHIGRRRDVQEVEGRNNTWREYFLY